MSPQVLQSVVSPIDTSWVYPQARQPKSKDENDQYRLRHINFSHDKITLSEGPQKTNRILSGDNNPGRNIITVSFEKLKFPDNYSAGPEYIARVLKKGVVLNGVTFKFYGHSNSQLKSRTCYMCAETNEKKIWDKINSFGDFGGIMSVGKRAKRIGLLFSAAEMGTKLDEKCTMDIPDVEDRGHVFTDGCGYISQWYAGNLARIKKIIFRDQRYVPSVFQIRYKGYKGVVMVNKDLDRQSKLDKTPLKDSIHFHFRDSMKKFKNCSDNTFSVLEYSKPYVYAKLNSELVSLLSCLGIPDDIFMKKLDDYLEFINSSTTNEQSTFRYLCYHDEFELAEKVVLDGLNGDPKILTTIKKKRTEDLKRFYDKNNLERVHIMIPDSRLLYGVADPTGKLKEGQVFVRIMKEGEGIKSLAGAEIIVGRNPCLHPGDVQKFAVVHLEELSHLVDCIVFSTKGSRPGPSLLSGGDLDGDKFFVCWDKDLIPSKLYEPYGYPPAKENIRQTIQYDDMINYFARYNNASLGKVKNLYLQWMKVRPAGAGSRECQELNALFSSCVDGQPVKIPDSLKEPPEQNPVKQFILDKICTKVKSVVTARVQTDDPSLTDTFPIEMINVLLSADQICMNEFELFQLVNRWTIKNKKKLTNFLYYFDFGAFTSIQKHWIIQEIPPEERVDWKGRILNELYTSEIITQYDLERHHLNSDSVQWKRFYSSINDNKGSKLSETLKTALELFHRKFIIVKVNPRFSYGLYFSKPITRDLVDLTNICKLFSFTNVSESHMTAKLITEKDYKLYFDGEVFQLYQHNKTNSFIFFRIGRPTNGQEKGNHPNRRNILQPQQQRQQQPQEDPGIKLMTSVALDKFSAGVKTHVGRVYREDTEMAEIYVLSNRDRLGHEILDISMNTVETQEIVPIIQNIPNEYTILTIDDINWDNYPPKISQIMKEWTGVSRNLTQIILDLNFNEFKSLCQVCTDFDLVNHLTVLIECFLDNLEHFQNIDGFSEYFLRDLLMDAPYMSVSISQVVDLRATQINTPSLRLSLCQALIRCGNEYREMSLNLFKRMVKMMILHDQCVDSSTYIELVKMIIYSIRDSDLCQDFLTELFSTSCGRRLVEVEEDVESNEYFVQFVLSSCMNYIAEVKENCPCGPDGRFLGQDDNSHKKDTTEPKPIMKCLEVKHNKETKEFETRLRIDIHHSIRIGGHLRLRAATKPKTTAGIQINRQTILDIVVKSIQNGCMKFEIQQRTPIEIETASWDMWECGSPTTLVTTLEALKNLVENKHAATWAYNYIVGHQLHGQGVVEEVEEDDMDKFLVNTKMNDSQIRATKMAMNNVMTLILGPPGTGKTSSVVCIVMMNLHFFPQKKILVTASTHNATDNILERLIAELENKPGFEKSDIVRVTSEVGKVKKSLQKYTMDAIVGGNINENQKLKKEALRRVQKAKIVASTCSGAGVGILRHEELEFPIVIVDEASQLTEPNALVPIVKGSTKIILVGDHIQLRPTVTELGKAYDLDYSLFERLYMGQDNPSRNNSMGIAKAMLEVQYRMHPLLVKFPNNSFYEGKLRSGVTESQRSLSASAFPWPEEESKEGVLSIHPVVFVPCNSPESRGASKSNEGQAKVVAEIIKKLRTNPQLEGQSSKPVPLQVTVLTPYTRQVKKLQDEVKGVDVFTIDGFQGRESDIIIFSTTRCNNHGSVGFLEDKRRMNVALTRAKFGLIVVGDEGTLSSNDMWREWLKECRRVEIVLSKR